MSAKAFIRMEVVDLFRDALQIAPDITFRYVRSEISRHLNRFRKRMVRERMSGLPGISGGKMRDRSNKNLRVWIHGKSKGDLAGYAKISRFLRYHEEGRTIIPKSGDYLYIRKGGIVVARVKKVVLPARLGFMDMWESMLPDGVARIEKAVGRAMKEIERRRVKNIVGVITGG